MESKIGIWRQRWIIKSSKFIINPFLLRNSENNSRWFEGEERQMLRFSRSAEQIKMVSMIISQQLKMRRETNFVIQWSEFTHINLLQKLPKNRKGIPEEQEDYKPTNFQGTWCIKTAIKNLFILNSDYSEAGVLVKKRGSRTLRKHKFPAFM